MKKRDKKGMVINEKEKDSLSMYNEKTLNYFTHPKNVGKIKDADSVGKVGNPYCGDVMWLYIKVQGKGDINKIKIKDAKFQTFGCVAAIASSSKVTEMIKGKTLNDVMKITKEQVSKELGGLPPLKFHCSLLAVDALSEALYDYLSKNKMKILEKIKQTHERIIKQNSIIKQKYKKFWKMQESYFEG